MDDARPTESVAIRLLRDPAPDAQSVAASPCIAFDYHSGCGSTALVTRVVLSECDSRASGFSWFCFAHLFAAKYSCVADKSFESAFIF